MTRIPLPGNMIDTLMKGLDTGSTLYSRAVQPILDREHQKQAEEHFKQQMALRKAAFARSGANQDIQRQILEQQLLGLTHKNDPMYELKQSYRGRHARARTTSASDYPRNGRRYGHVFT